MVENAPECKCGRGSEMVVVIKEKILVGDVMLHYFKKIILFEYILHYLVRKLHYLICIIKNKIV